MHYNKIFKSQRGTFSLSMDTASQKEALWFTTMDMIPGSLCGYGS